jgi:hypothetical protein
MPQCTAVTQHDNRGRAGQRCTRDAIRGSEPPLCHSHNGEARSLTPEKIGRYIDNPGEKCTARRADGDPCRNFAIKGSHVCRIHGGSTKAARVSAAQRMIEMRLKAIGVVDGMLDDPSIDPNVRLRAAQIVLDRSGMGPSSKIEHEVEVKPWERLLQEATIERDIPALEDKHAAVEAEVTEEHCYPEDHLGEVEDFTPAPEPNVVAFPHPPARYGI